MHLARPVGISRRQGGDRRDATSKRLRREMLEELDTDVAVRAMSVYVPRTPIRRSPRDAALLSRCELAGDAATAARAGDALGAAGGAAARWSFPPADEELIALLTQTGRDRLEPAEPLDGLPATRRAPPCSTDTTAAVGRQVAVHVGERDRARERGETAALVTTPDSRGRRPRTSRAAPAPSPSSFSVTSRARHAAVPAVQHADDHFLADVAALASWRSRATRCRPRAGWCPPVMSTPKSG